MPKQLLTSPRTASMSVREAGRRGGNTVKAQYGIEFFQEIGRKGGRVRAQSEDILSGRLGKLGAAVRWGKKRRKNVKR